MEKSNKPKTVECILIKDVLFGATKKNGKPVLKKKGSKVSLTKEGAFSFFSKNRISRNDYLKAQKL